MHLRIYLWFEYRPKREKTKRCERTTDMIEVRNEKELSKEEGAEKLKKMDDIIKAEFNSDLTAPVKKAPVKKEPDSEDCLRHILLWEGPHPKPTDLFHGCEAEGYETIVKN